MNGLLRIAGGIFIVVGVLGGIGLIVLAQPEESYGSVNKFLVASGIASGVSSAALGVLFFEVARIGKKVDEISSTIGRLKTTLTDSDNSKRTGGEGSVKYRECKRNGNSPFRADRDVCPHCRNVVKENGQHPLKG